MKLLEKDKKEKFRFGNYQPNKSSYRPTSTMTMPIGMVDEVNRRYEEEKQSEKKLGFIEKIKLFFNKTWIKFSKLFICILAPTIYVLERFYWHENNFIIFAGNYLLGILFSWVALNDLFRKEKGQ